MINHLASGILSAQEAPPPPKAFFHNFPAVNRIQTMDMI
jgi:hypothetical protein